MAMRVQDVLAQADRDPEFASRLQQNPKETLTEVARQRRALENDRFVYRTVVVALGATVLVAALGAIFLQFNDKDTPSVLVALGSAAVGAIAGLLAPSPAATNQ